MDATAVTPVEADRRIAVVVTGGVFALTAAAVLVTMGVPSLAAVVRQALALSFTEAPGSLREAGEIATTNARVVGALLLLGTAVRSRLLPRRVVYVAAATVVGFNVAVVGAAIGGYGLATMAPWLPHVPLEWTALGLAAATLGMTSPGSTRRRAALASAALIVAAALVETYCSPVSV